jgi:hypothetical protein
MLAAMIARGETARDRYLARLAQSGLAISQRRRLRHLLMVLEERLTHLRWEHAALLQIDRDAVPPQPQPEPQASRRRGTYRSYLPRPDSADR